MSVDNCMTQREKDSCEKYRNFQLEEENLTFLENGNVVRFKKSASLENEAEQREREN